MRLPVAMIFILGLSAGAAAAECVGTNLLETMPADQRAEINAATKDVPFARGILWQATKGDQKITMVGTYHFTDPRHQVTLSRLQPALQDAAALYVEAGPVEEKKLTDALTADPDLMVDPTGPTLPERLSDEDWQVLSSAMEDRGTPAVVTSRLRPWYVAMMLGISPCMMTQLNSDGGEGLDQLLVQEAEDMDIPVIALEPWDTVFSLFGDMTPKQEIDMIRVSLPVAAHADDYGVTLSDAYFDSDIWTIWEFGRFDAYRNSDMSRAQVDEQMMLAQTKLMDSRNKSWIAPLTKGAAEAAAQGKSVVAGFGALHLPGENGVLRLLEKDGWTIRPLQ
ncbi:TraB/GumN family protein [Paracoccus sp. 11-3]|uniref:TraB/GumN family protein n=1 Tax=Paracoccus amoyensis TaxID=2760093 RepID=A0A926JBE8_9RHOB|nr:TraB/GumN family protein [Paracoccus amoyensis]MBC9247031.1 TraB/GumN family protein [Paracoccus amoyensis]